MDEDLSWQFGQDIIKDVEIRYQKRDKLKSITKNV